MPDRGLRQERHSPHQERDILQVQIVPRIDHQTSRPSRNRGRRDPLQNIIKPPVTKRRRIQARVDLNTVRTGRPHPLDHIRARIDEQDHPAPQRLHRRDRRRHQRGLRRIEFPPLLRRENPRRIRHQSHLLRPDVTDNFHKTFVRITLDIEFNRRPVRPHQVRHNRNISGTNMSLVRPRMHGQPLRPRRQREFAKSAQIGHAGAAGIPQQGDLVQIHAKSGHAPDRSASQPTTQRGGNFLHLSLNGLQTIPTRDTG